MSMFWLLTLTFVTVTVGLTAGYYVLTEVLFRHQSQVRDRLEKEFRKDSGPAPRSALFKNLDRLQMPSEPEPRLEPDFGSPDGPTGLTRRKDLKTRFFILLERSGLDLTVQQLFMIAGALALVLGVSGTVWRGAWLGLTAAALGASVPFLWVVHRFKARKEKIVAQLPGAFDLMARVVRSGQSIPQAFQAVADTCEKPISAEFADCQRQQTMGLPPETTLRDMAERCDILEIRIFVMAMLIQRQTGGNLAEALERLAGLVRDRLRLHRQVKTLTAEGRMQGLTLFVLPFVVFGAMMAINRTYAEVLLTHVSLLVATGVSMVIGMLWIRSIVNFKP